MKFYAAALAEEPVTPSQLFVLRQMWREDGLPLRDVGIRSHLDATSTTWIVDQLEKAGLLERRRGDPDRRLVRVWLTDAGRALGNDLLPRIARWETALRDVIHRHHTATEIAAFESVLTTLSDVLPEGDDLWASIAAAWDQRLIALKDMLESSTDEGDDGDDQQDHRSHS